MVKRNNWLDLIKAISVVFVLLYHLGICEAGFLAVCLFFTVSGYLFSNSINSDKFSIGKYYLKRLKGLYLPLLIVVFITVLCFRYLVDIPWVTIKQETVSVLGSYNNFFQIANSSNYFVRADQSPFTHMWYIAILMQIEFILPLFCLLIKKGKVRKMAAYIATVLSILAFVFIDLKDGISVSYYHTLSRCFSFFIGCSAYHIQTTNFKGRILILIGLVLSFLIGTYVQDVYTILMIIDSLLCGILIIYTRNIELKENRLVKYISEISYPVYLLQFPVIYVVSQLSDFSTTVNIIIEAVITIVLSAIMNAGLKANKESSFLRKAIMVILLLLTAGGIYGYVTCPDYYKEMELLKEQLAQSEEEMLKKQNEYLERLKNQKQDLDNNLDEINKAIENIDETVKNTQLAFIGDSVMLGGSYHMDKVFNNYYCDAEGSRGGYLGSDVLEDMLEKGVVGDYLIIHLGTNWGLELDEVEEINALLEGRNVKIFWLTVTNGWRKNENPMLEEYCNTHENNYLMDWYTYSLDKKDLFHPDGIHLNDYGRLHYDEWIFENLKPVIKADFEKKKAELEESYNSEINSRISMYGNDILFDITDILDSTYTINLYKGQTFETLCSQIENDINNSNISNTAIIVLDKTLKPDNRQIEQLSSLLGDRDYHILAYGIEDTETTINLDNILYKTHELIDGVHLNQTGKELLLSTIQNIITK